MVIREVLRYGTIYSHIQSIFSQYSILEHTPRTIPEHTPRITPEHTPGTIPDSVHTSLIQGPTRLLRNIAGHTGRDRQKGRYTVCVIYP